MDKERAEKLILENLQTINSLENKPNLK